MSAFMSVCCMYVLLLCRTPPCTTPHLADQCHSARTHVVTNIKLPRFAYRNGGFYRNRCVCPSRDCGASSRMPTTSFNFPHPHTPFAALKCCPDIFVCVVSRLVSGCVVCAMCIWVSCVLGAGRVACFEQCDGGVACVVPWWGRVRARAGGWGRVLWNTQVDLWNTQVDPRCCFHFGSHTHEHAHTSTRTHKLIHAAVFISVRIRTNMHTPPLAAVESRKTVPWRP